jgi:UDP-glucose 4-epimerase
MSPRTIAVVGAAGFIGVRLRQTLGEHGHRVVGFVRDAAKAAPGDEVVDLDDLAGLTRTLTARSVDTVVHAAWTDHPRSAGVDYDGQLVRNVDPSARLAVACGEAGVGHLIFLSSGGGLNRAPHPERRPPAYGWAKRVTEGVLEATAHDFGYAVATLRPTAVYGPGQDPTQGLGAVTVFLSQLLRGEAVHFFGSPSVSRDFLHVDDLAECVERVVATGTRGTFEVGGPEVVRLDELVALMEATLERTAQRAVVADTGIDPTMVYLDDRPITDATGWRPMRRLAGELGDVAIDIAQRLGLTAELPPSLQARAAQEA